MSSGHSRQDVWWCCGQNYRRSDSGENFGFKASSLRLCYDRNCGMYKRWRCSRGSGWRRSIIILRCRRVRNISWIMLSSIGGRETYMWCVGRCIGIWLYERAYGPWEDLNWSLWRRREPWKQKKIGKFSFLKANCVIHVYSSIWTKAFVSPVMCTITKKHTFVRAKTEFKCIILLKIGKTYTTKHFEKVIMGIRFMHQIMRTLKV